MKSVLAALLGIALSTITYLVVEGAYAVLRGGEPGWSIGYQLLDRAARWVARDRSSADGEGHIILQEKQVVELLDDFRRDGVALGISPFIQLRNENVAFNYRDQGCLRQKPNLDRTMVYLRATVFEAFNPPNAFFDTGRKLSPAVAEFIKVYGIRRIRHRTNGHGERFTDPVIQSPNKVLIAGDSVANGAGVMDSETIASNLQRMDNAFQYVNVGVGGAEARDIICNLEKAADRYVGQIRKLIYIYCENDFKMDEHFGQPEEVLNWLSDFARKQRIDKVAIVYAPFIFNVFPDVTRIKGDKKGWKHSFFRDEKRRLRTLAADAGFEWIGITNLGRQEVERGRSSFAGLSLYIDRVYLSPKGSELVARYILSQ